MSRDNFMVPDERLLPVYDADGHVDEGTIHTWIDGAYDAAAAADVSRHVAGCAQCSAAIAEARGLVAASARVLGTLDGVPSSVVPQFGTAGPGHVGRVERKTWDNRWWFGVAATVVVGIGVVRYGGMPRGTTEAGTAVAATTTQPLVAAPSTPSGTTEARTAEARTAGAGTPGAGNDGLRTEAGTTVAPALRAAPTATVAPALRAAQTAETKTAEVQTGELQTAEAKSAVAQVASRKAADAAPTGTVIVTGAVVDAATSTPISSAEVAISSRASLSVASRSSVMVTGPDGRYRVAVANVARGAQLFVRVRRLGYQLTTREVVATADSLAVDFSLPMANTMLSSVMVQGEAPRAERRMMVGATASVVAIPSSPSSQPPAGYGVAGGVARGVAGGIAKGKESVSTADVRNQVRQAPGDREQYDRIEDNPFLAVQVNPLSTFSIDVDRAAYGNVRRFLNSGQRPPKDAVRIEEFINYFPYTLPSPRGNDPVAISSEVIGAPWQPKHQLVRIALQAKRIETADLPPNNLVFLIDVSGSMNEWTKLPLVKQSLRLLVDQLRPQDKVAIVVYAGSAGLVLPSTSGEYKSRIAEAIDRLEAGGSTAGGAGIELAYRTAREAFLERGNNRVILATDGDFNVGASSDGELERLIERKRTEGTYLTVLGYGTGNYQASKMEKLAKVGNGNFAYVDDLAEAKKVLVEEMGATLLTVANDVKLQVEFNPSRVQGYRLIGYENRLLRNEDFTDDTKDAGDIGAGHQVTALYEVVPVGVTGTVSLRGVDSLRYVTPERLDARSAAGSNELLFVKLRYKRPGESASRLMSHAVPARVNARPSEDTRFVAAVAQFGMLLRDSEHKGNSNAAQVLEMARAALGEDNGGYRAEFVRLVERWRELGFTAGERR